jgi:hypothetical protein
MDEPPHSGWSATLFGLGVVQPPLGPKGQTLKKKKKLGVVPKGVV